MTLRELLHGVTATPIAPVPIAGMVCHSKQVRSGDLFIALPGSTADGHEFIQEAVERGAAAVVAQRLPDRLPRACPCAVVPDTRQALAVVAERFYGHPTKRLKLLGVTGTNGKTTTTYLLKAILESAGERAGLLGTVIYQIGARRLPSTNTTPGILELQRYFAQMVAEGIRWCAMEVSSHALAQDRIARLEFEAAVCSNLGSDHLDYHKTPEAYAAAKRRLFDHLRPEGCAVLNVDDAFGRTLAETLPRRRVLTYGLEQPAQVQVRHIECSWAGTNAVLETPWGIVPVETPLIGRHNVYNLAAAATVLLGSGLAPEAIRQGLKTLEGVPGRLERVSHEAGFEVIVDYAHTADALRSVLLSMRELTRGRLLVVFGCGGDRDKTKRPIMGRMAALLADYVILTSDNPRSESPEDIIRQIRSGFPPGFQQYQVVVDREQAIARAFELAQPNDTVLIAGKGHETSQIFEHVTVPFSDRDVAERLLNARQCVSVAV